MPTGDIPHISTSNYASTAYTGMGQLIGNTTSTIGAGDFGMMRWVDDDNSAAGGLAALNNARRLSKQNMLMGQSIPLVENTTVANDKPSTRFVRVIIVDPNENIPLDDRLIFSGKEKLTDLTDQELFFELDIRDMLAKHNEKRVKVVDKKVKDRTEYLEAAKIRDLRMVVVNVASF